MRSGTYYMINAITLYRLLAAPVLVVLIFTGYENVFRWMLAFSFFTDLIDGYLARRFHVSSVLGSKLDSIADDLTIVAAMVGIFVFKYSFVREVLAVLLVLFFLFIVQTVLALIKYRKISSFHTYLAKVAAILQGLFLILVFFLPEVPYYFFYTAALITALDLVEEIILVILIPKWKINVRGIYWVLRNRRGRSKSEY